MSIEQWMLIVGLGVAGFLIVNNVLTPHKVLPDWRDVLGVADDATTSEIDAAFSRLIEQLDAPSPPAFARENMARRAAVVAAYHAARRHRDG